MIGDPARSVLVAEPGGRDQGRGSGQIFPSQTKAGPSQTKKTGLDFLGFLRPIRGFFSLNSAVPVSRFEANRALSWT